MNNKLKTSAIMVGVFALGGITGSGIAGANSATQAAPTPTTTVTAPAKVIETVPSACRTALDHADQTLDLTSKAFTLTADAMGAMQNGDTVKLVELTADLRELRPQLEGSVTAYRADADKCRAKVI